MLVDNARLVLNSSIIHRCPYELIEITKGRFNVNDGMVLMNNESDIILEPISKERICNLTMFSTSEGLFVTDSKNKEKLIKKEVKYQADSDLIN